jgi:hypothetical protein
VAADGFTQNNLHHFWDIEFVERLGSDSAETTGRLIARISDERRQAWSHRTAADWALASFVLAHDHAYGMLPAASAEGVYALPPAYVDTAARDVALQLSKAATRLAFLLNHVSASGRAVGH